MCSVSNAFDFFGVVKKLEAIIRASVIWLCLMETFEFPEARLTQGINELNECL